MAELESKPSGKYKQKFLSLTKKEAAGIACLLIGQLGDVATGSQCGGAPMVFVRNIPLRLHFLVGPDNPDWVHLRVEEKPNGNESSILVFSRISAARFIDVLVRILSCDAAFACETVVTDDSREDYLLFVQRLQ